MAIKIKHTDPKSTDFGPNDIVINVKEGTLFYKSEKNIFKLTGDNLDKTNDLITLNSNISASKAFFATPGIGGMVIGSQNNNVFEVGTKTLVVGGSIIPSSSLSSKYDLGSLDEPWKDIYLSSDSLHFVKHGKGIGFSQIENGFIIEGYSIQSIKESKTLSLTHDPNPNEKFDNFKIGGAGLVVEGSITASGHTIKATTGSFDHFITLGDTIEFINKTTKAVEGFLKFDTSDGLQIQSADRNPTRAKFRDIYATNITSSGNISCSGTVIADAFQSTGTDDQLDFSDHINVRGNITSSNHIKAVGFTGSLTGDVIGEATNVSNALTIGTGVDLNSGVNWDGTHARTLSLDLTEVGFGGGANRLITDDGDGTVSTEANLTYDGDGINLTGHITASGAITASQFEGSNIGSIYETYIYITPAEFFPDDITDYSRTRASGIGGNGAYLADGGSINVYTAMKMIPKGYKATKTMVYDNNPAASTYTTYSSSVSVTTAGLNAGICGTATATNTEKDITDITGGSGVYCILNWTPAAANRCYGGYIRLEKT